MTLQRSHTGYQSAPKGPCGHPRALTQGIVGKVSWTRAKRIGVGLKPPSFCLLNDPPYLLGHCRHHEQNDNETQVSVYVTQLKCLELV